jgi:hypothetical protein
MRIVGVLIVLLATATPIGATERVDGAVLMQCAIETVMVCDDPWICVRGTARTANVSPTITVDIGGRVVRGVVPGEDFPVESVSRGAGRLLLRGLGSTTSSVPAWDMVIEEASGRMYGAVLVPGGGFLIFGVCSAQ